MMNNAVYFSVFITAGLLNTTLMSLVCVELTDYFNMMAASGCKHNCSNVVKVEALRRHFLR